MVGRFKKISDPDGNDIDHFRTMSESAFIERLDGRNPLFKYYKHRFTIRGNELSAKFVRWMTSNFGPSMGYGLAKHYVKCNQSLDDTPWVYQHDASTYWHHTQIYFNRDCEVLIRLNFMQGNTL
jgi:hypothetical protein